MAIKINRQSLPKLQMGSPEEARRALTLMAVLCGLLALWFMWSGLRLWWAQAADEALMFERDRVAGEIGHQFGALSAQVVEAVAKPEVAEALKAGDREAAAALTAALPKAAAVEVYPADLGAFYDKLPETGYGKLAVVEEVQMAGKPVMRVGRSGAGGMLLAGVPLPEGAAALAAFPLTEANRLIATVKTGNGYIALRQGMVNVIQDGDPALAGTSEANAAPVRGGGFRIAIGLPTAEAGPYGLGALACGAIGLLLAIVAGLLLAWPRLNRRRPAAVVDEAEAPTLGETLAAAPLTQAEGRGRVSLADRMGMEEIEMSQDSNVAAGLAPERLDRDIFRAYDIRGVVGQGLDAEVARAIGQAVGSLMREQGLSDIVVGRDGRLSGPALSAALIEGLRSTGRKVIDIGLAPTPLVYFAAYHLRAGSCVAVTGSHNPPDYNGFKIVVGGETLSGEAIVALYQRIVEGRLYRAAGPGALETRDAAGDYLQRVAADIQLGRPLRVVVDAGNGAAGDLGPKVLEAIGAEVEPLYCEIDGHFPNHHPDPSDPHNLADLTQAVQRSGADIGLAFDGDGDRLGVVTPAGRNVFPDRLLMLFAADVLERQPGAVIVYDVKCTGALMPWVLRHGGSPLMWKTGHSFIKAKMRETDAELAGEMSGHFFFKERWYGFDDGIYSAARLLEILAARTDDADTVFAGIPEGISTPELKIPVEDPHAFIERFVAMGDFAEARSNTIDGLRADWKNGWGLVRASNTTPILVLRFEAVDEPALREIQEAFRERLLALEPALDIPF
ncbi:phosphomannomutase/phosphoglucomutase [Lysobacter pythonis]|uniref:phosphomannomutase n=1 Tax=Solilutibacter pythonis TaxID=2483112 RepID=A0A3M2HHB9_9GAMM|nr:phosphomannomutase/phosphoglucomutase [Lysobacter pythonis]RMH89106.1 phosphomannomutase/phosphoglucomutase [Lysobacter pythonis]